MHKIEPLNAESASGATKDIFDGIMKKIGKVPNLYAVMGHSAVALGASLANQGNLEKGEFSPKEIQAVMLAVSQVNKCNYCLAAHTTIGKMVGFTEDETIALRAGTHSDKKLKALTDLAREITDQRGRPNATFVDAFFSAGYTKAALIELIAWVSYKINLNYVNEVAGTPIDFPAAPELHLEKVRS